VAFVIMKVYCEKTGVNIQNLMPKRYVYIGDEKDIEANFLKSVLLVLDLEVMSAGENGKFEPKKPVTGRNWQHPL